MCRRQREWQCAGILCSQILRRRKEHFNLSYPQKGEKMQIAEEEIGLEHGEFMHAPLTCDLRANRMHHYNPRALGSLFLKP